VPRSFDTKGQKCGIGIDAAEQGAVDLVENGSRRMGNQKILKQVFRVVEKIDEIMVHELLQSHRQILAFLFGFQKKIIGCFMNGQIREKYKGQAEQNKQHEKQLVSEFALQAGPQTQLSPESFYGKTHSFFHVFIPLMRMPASCERGCTLPNNNLFVTTQVSCVSKPETQKT